MVNSFADWLCNVMVWGAIVALIILLAEAFVSQGFLTQSANLVTGLAGLAVVAVLATLWPKY
ncbi:MAG TPA: hypothetical protein VJ740_09845 [Hyphomicrobiaceae bacterium]|nr:hypothetical protein [Hyphomicrobiaceae bacterium]